jgi:hypothetical protein
LGNASFHAEDLKTKLMAKTKALEEARAQLSSIEAKHTEELAATKNAASQAIQEVEARAVEAENSLAKTTQEQSKCKEAATNRLKALSVAFGNTLLLTCYSFVQPHTYMMTLTFHATAEQIGETFPLHADRAEDAIFDAVGVLESNCKNARMVLQNTYHALTCLFGILFPKKKDELPQNLRKLVEAFNTPE